MINAGERLKEARLEKGLTLDEAEKKTKIKKQFLSAIERGAFRELPSPAYAKGFIQNYAEFLGISKREILPLFKREFDEKREIKVLPEGLTRQRVFPTRHFRIRRAIVGIIFFLLLVVGFIFFQYRHAFFPPSLRITSPKEGATTGQQVAVSGKTDSDVAISINNFPVAVDGSGRFSVQVSLFPGKNTISIIAKNRFGKEATIERHIDTK